ncbi:MAG TPA: S8 family serine peptidase, partial [Thermoanaerobaculia bacterium]|nr:S8 family serine peptidase [Thermoanaerobaculia bacterium]
PDANVRAISIFGANNSSSKAIINAANLLSAGDIILIELHRPGPRFNFTAPQGQRGFIAVEWWPDDLAAIQFAVAKGVIVVEAAGNGFENLDDPIYSVRPAGFPANWVNPFKRNPVDSGAIVVGAGAPPSGNFGADRSRLDFSNWGALVDAQGWGREVVTCGYGDLQGGQSEDLWYTKQFSGTSSASPIVVGAAACVQGWLRAAGRPLLTPAQMRSRLRSTGSPQQNGPNGPATQRIGNRPNLRQLHGALFPKSILKDANDNKGIVKEIEKVKDNKEFEKKDFKEFKETKELKDKDKEKDKDLKDKDKDVKEFKELKEKDKDFEKATDKVADTTSASAAAPAGTIAQRLAALEQSVQSLTHFITSELRPDLSSSALSGESDLQGDLQKQASDAKALKDDKDVEKTRDR